MFVDGCEFTKMLGTDVVIQSMDLGRSDVASDWHDDLVLC